MPSITEQIRQTLARRDGVPEDKMLELADAYSAEVTRVNERLSKAVALLHKGLRSEAIQSACLNPNAIDAAAALDFPEFDDWCEILQFYSIPLPQELQRDMVDQLNEAMVDAQPLDALLKHHRRLAIARAPLAWRLKTLRRIAEIDSTNGVWQDDIEVWERARVKQLEPDVKDAVATKDEPRLRALLSELTGSAWRIEVDRDLAITVKSAIDEINQTRVAGELSKLASSIYDAFCQFDEPAARKLIADWDRTAANFKSPVDPEWVEQVSGAVEWLKEIDREASEKRERAAALGKLDAALDRRADRHALDAAFGALSQFDEPPPIELIQRYRLAVEQIEIAGKRRNQAILAAIAATAAIIVGIVVVWQRADSLERQILSAETQLRSMVDNKRLLDAETFWSKLEADSPNVVRDSRLTALNASLQSLLVEDASRAQQFNQYLTLADVQSPDAMDLSSLGKAESLASTEDEKASAFGVRRRYTQWEAEIETNQTTQLLAVIAGLKSRLDEIEKLPADQVANTSLVEVLSSIDELASTYRRANTSAKAQVTSLKNRGVAIRDALRDRRMRQQAETEAIARIIKSATLNDLERNLKAFSGAVPNSPLTTEFEKAADERKHWDLPEEWNTLASAVATALDNPFTDQIVSNLIAQDRVLKTRLASNPAAASTGKWLDRMSRYDGRVKALQGLLGDLSDTVVADLYTMVDSDGQGKRHFIYNHYYDRMKAMLPKPDPRSLELVANGSGATKRSDPLVGPFKVTQEPFATIRWLTVQHQSMTPTLAKDWDRELLKLIAELRSRRDLDSLIKEMLVAHLLAGTAEESPELASQLVKELALLSQRAHIRDTWYEPAPPSDKLASEIEEGVIKRIAELYRSLPSVSQESARLRKRKYIWVGCIVRDSAGNTMPHLQRTVDDNGQLAVARASAESPAQTDIVVVGTIAEGTPALNRNSRDQLAGRPLFFVAD